MSTARDKTEGASLVVVGLGPGGAEYQLPAVKSALDDADVVFLRTAEHPGAEALIANGARPFDSHYENASTFEETYEGIVEEIVAATRTHERVVYAVPGSPFVLESTVEALVRDERVDVAVLPAMSFVELVWDRLRLDPFVAHVRLIDAASFSLDGARDPGPFLLAQAWNATILSQVKLAVDPFPPDGAVILHHLGQPDEQVLHVAWEDLDRTLVPDHLTCLYIPALAQPVGFELAALEEVIRTLRQECPWDRVQTHKSLVRHLLEETYEVIEAIEELGEPAAIGQSEHLEEELGDLYCQILFHCVLAGEEGLFDIGDVARTVREKLVHRHPHVFGDKAELHTESEVLMAWEEIKREEKGRTSLMDGIPAAFPALLLAAKIERKARGVELGVEHTGVPREQLLDDLDQLLSGDAKNTGELLFGIARLAIHEGVDPEEALRRAASVFRERFVGVEARLAKDNQRLAAVDGETARALFFDSQSA